MNRIEVGFLTFLSFAIPMLMLAGIGFYTVMMDLGLILPVVR